MDDLRKYILTLALLNPTLFALQWPSYWVKGFERCREKRRSNSKLSQAEANELCEGSKIDIVDMMSDTFALILSCFWFAPVYPGSLFIGFIGCILNWFAYRFVIMLGKERPPLVSAQMMTWFVKKLPLVLLANVVTMQVFGPTIKRVTGRELGTQYLFGVSLAYILFHIQFLR